MASPDDMSGLEAAFHDGSLRAEDVVGVIAKTEGNGKVNDFSRPFAHRCFTELLARWTDRPAAEIDEQVALVMSGGCEGVISPHATVFSRRDVNVPPLDGQKRLSVSTANTRELAPEEVGAMAQVDLVAAAVREALAAADLDSLDDVHYVQVKCPLLTSERINDAKARGKTVATEDTARSMGLANGASALGIALGLGEIRGPLDPRAIGNDHDLYTLRGAASSGIEMLRCQVLLLGNSPNAVGNYVCAHAMMEDLIDAEGVRKALRLAGIPVETTVSESDRDRIINVFAKGQIPVHGRVRGRRTTLLTDTDLNTRPSRAVLGAVVASVVGDPAIYASAGMSYHQGPIGAGVASVVARIL
ncbi:MAG TPA: ring-opening amidohydrolase [Casimicrobiaceae bacterium]|nr:ring-opening amidohydrolase [Casimicrobiaceae bacterium]